MNVKISMDENRELSMSMGSERVRKDDLAKWLGRNNDAILVKLKGHHNWPGCKPGHICKITEGQEGYDVFVGSHCIGQLPDEAIAFARQIDYSPEFMISIVGKTENDDIFIYVAE